MDTNQSDQEQIDVDALMKERFAKLPKVIQNAITSAEVEGHLRKLADTHKLHLDQWQLLENQVIMALLGFEHVEDLEENIKTEVHIDTDTARALTKDIMLNVFEPIREELERELDKPAAGAQEGEPIEDTRDEVLMQNKNSVPTAQTQSQNHAAQSPEITPQGGANTQKQSEHNAQSTLDAKPEEEESKSIRGPSGSEYKPGQPSIERKNVVDDPYREPVDE